MVSQKQHEAEEVMEDIYKKGKQATAEKACEIKESANKEAAKKSASEKAQELKEPTKESLHKSKETGKDVARDLSEQMEKIKESEEVKAKEKTEVKNKAGAFFRNAADRVISPEGVISLLGVINLLGLGMAFGMCIWVTFISSYVLARALPRQQFAVVQSKVYPVYFQAMAYAITIALMEHVFGYGRGLLSSKAGIFQAYNLLAAIWLVLFNAVYLETLATKVMYDRMKLENEEGRRRSDSRGEGEPQRQQPVAADPSATTTTTQAENVAPVAPESPERGELRRRFARMSERLKKLNSDSALLNIVTLMCLSWHLVYLAHRLHVPC